MNFTVALDLNRSLTALSAQKCDLSKAVRREWAGALNGNPKARLAAFQGDAFLVWQPLPKEKVRKAARAAAAAAERKRVVQRPEAVCLEID